MAHCKQEHTIPKRLVDVIECANPQLDIQGSFYFAMFKMALHMSSNLQEENVLI